VASLLIKNGADPNSRDDGGQSSASQGITGQTGGHRAVITQDCAAARLLVNSGVNLNITDSQCWTPLHEAARSGYREIAELLVGSKVGSGASLYVRTSE
jgi:ankyrin repeat protein